MISVKKQFIYLFPDLLEKKDFFFQISISTFKRLRCKDSLKRTFGEHVLKEKKKEKERKKYRKLNYPYLH